METEKIQDVENIYKHYPQFIKPINSRRNHSAVYKLFNGQTEIKKGTLTDLSNITGKINYFIRSEDEVVNYKWNTLYAVWSRIDEER